MLFYERAAELEPVVAEPAPAPEAQVKQHDSVCGENAAPLFTDTAEPCAVDEPSAMPVEHAAVQPSTPFDMTLSVFRVCSFLTPSRLNPPC